MENTDKVTAALEELKAELENEGGFYVLDLEETVLRQGNIRAIVVNTRLKRDHPAKSKLVSVRIAGEEKTHLGFYVGDMTNNLALTAKPIIKGSAGPGLLEVTPITNPAIFIPALGRTVWGAESWWSPIESIDDFKEITDQDIAEAWYVKAAKQMMEENNDTPTE